MYVWCKIHKYAIVKSPKWLLWWRAAAWNFLHISATLLAGANVYFSRILRKILQKLCNIGQILSFLINKSGNLSHEQLQNIQHGFFLLKMITRRSAWGVGVGSGQGAYLIWELIKFGNIIRSMKLNRQELTEFSSDTLEKWQEKFSIGAFFFFFFLND